MSAVLIDGSIEETYRREIQDLARSAATREADAKTAEARAQEQEKSNVRSESASEN